MAETNYNPNLGVIFSAVSAAPSKVYSFVGVPSGSYAEGSFGINISNGNIYQVQSGSWVLISVGGGSVTVGDITYSASSDPSGVPTGNKGQWWRLDLGKEWVYNAGTATWDLVLS